jgi:hypothetical protein
MSLLVFVVESMDLIETCPSVLAVDVNLSLELSEPETSRKEAQCSSLPKDLTYSYLDAGAGRGSYWRDDPAEVCNG